MTRRESVNGVLPTRLVCPWWARGVDSACQEEGGSGLGTFEKSKDKKDQEEGGSGLGTFEKSKDKKELGTERKDGTQRKEVQPFMSVEPNRQKSVVLKPRHCLE